MECSRPIQRALPALLVASVKPFERGRESPRPICLGMLPVGIFVIAERRGLPHEHVTKRARVEQRACAFAAADVEPDARPRPKAGAAEPPQYDAVIPPHRR